MFNNYFNNIVEELNIPIDQNLLKKADIKPVYKKYDPFDKTTDALVFYLFYLKLLNAA